MSEDRINKLKDGQQNSPNLHNRDIMDQKTKGKICGTITKIQHAYIRVLGRKKGMGLKQYLKKIMAENFINLAKDTNL